jgi:signal transduction histidine kinase
MEESFAARHTFPARGAALARRSLEPAVTRVLKLQAAMLARLTLVQRFMIFSFIVLSVAGYALASYVADEIEGRVVQRTSAITALYVDSFISPHLQELAVGSSISRENFATLNTLLEDTALGEKVVSFKVWTLDGEVVYARDDRLLGQTFPTEHGLGAALDGDVHVEISGLAGAENVYERERWDRLIETYAPVREDKSGAIIGVSEFYQDPADLTGVISDSRREAWLIVAAGTIVAYILLSAMVKRASNTIFNQNKRLSALADENAALALRVHSAAVRKWDADEHLLARFAQDLHDGPAQDVSVAILRLDALEEESGHSGVRGRAALENLKSVRTALESGLNELRQISAGLRPPDVEDLSIAEVVTKAATDHENKTGCHVTLSLRGDIKNPKLSLSTTVYRVAQEALNNSFQHSGVHEQEVVLVTNKGTLRLEIRDAGVGLVGSANDTAPDTTAPDTPGIHVGLRGMRERVDLLGGNLDIQSSRDGTTVAALIPVPRERGV